MTSLSDNIEIFRDSDGCLKKKVKQQILPGDLIVLEGIKVGVAVSAKNRLEILKRSDIKSCVTEYE